MGFTKHRTPRLCVLGSGTSEGIPASTRCAGDLLGPGLGMGTCGQGWGMCLYPLLSWGRQWQPPFLQGRGAFSSPCSSLSIPCPRPCIPTACLVVDRLRFISLRLVSFIYACWCPIASNDGHYVLRQCGGRI